MSNKNNIGYKNVKIDPPTYTIIIVLGLITSSIHEFGAMLAENFGNFKHLNGSFDVLY